MWTSTAALWLLLGATAPPPPLATVPVAVSQDDEALQKAFVALQDEYDSAYGEWRSAYSAAAKAQRDARATNPDAPFEGPDRIEPTFFPRFDRMAAAGHSGAALWCLSNYSSDLPKEAKARDFAFRATTYLTHPSADLGAFTSTIARQSGGRGLLDIRTSRSLLGLVETLAPDKEVRARAAHSVANLAGHGIEDQGQSMKARLEATRAVAKAYPATKSGKRAAGYVFSQEKLQIGMVAPDIVGADVDGNAMRLSDFRGKVTVIDFWGFW